MKKFLIAALAVILGISVLTMTGCSKSKGETTPNTAVSALQEIPKEEEVKEKYMEIIKTLPYDKIISSLEQEGYKCHYDQTTNIWWCEDNDKMYYPVAFKKGNSTVILYTNFTGALKSSSSDWYGDIHTEENGEAILMSPTEEWIFKEGKIQKWSLGELKDEVEMPKDSIYCGHSYWAGFIFRSGSQIYSYSGANDFASKPTLIANEVAKVIDTDYSLGSDEWSQPLFLMTDGSIKAYVTWEGDEKNPASLDHLVELEGDGDYDKTYVPYNR